MLTKKELNTGESGQSGWLAMGLKIEETQYAFLHNVLWLLAKSQRGLNFELLHDQLMLR